jgi:hypothetical protein
MADEAFALSPISARAALPSEEDYAAISEAFMETARGRWFLGEYAKRNRNADTSMVLDAVARIEEALVAQRQAAAAEDAGQAQAEAVTEAVTQVLAAIRDTVDSAQASAVGALDGFAPEQQLTAVRKGARVIREIAWRLREIGNDSRICDLIDSQVSVIETGAGEISPDEVRSALRAAFASIRQHIAELGGDQQFPAQTPEAAVAPPFATPSDETPVAVAATIEAAPVPEVSKAPGPMLITEAEAALAEAELAEAETADVEAIAAPAEVIGEAAIVDDEALLDMIALEMGAPDPDDSDIDALLADEARIAEPAPAEAEIVAQAPEPIAEPPAPPVQLAPPAVVKPPPETSLGATIIASGMMTKPTAANDPLAPIRRMSQVEKIALFS